MEALDDQTKPNYIQTHDDNPNVIKLKRTVVLGYCDVAGASSRALLNVDARYELHSLSFSEDLKSLRPSATLKDGADLSAVQILNLKYEQYSVVVLNSHLSGSNCYIVLNALFDIFAYSQIESLIVVCALPIDVNSSDDDVLEKNFFTHAKTTYTILNASVRLTDPILLTLMQLIQLETLATNLFIIPATRTWFRPGVDDKEGAKLILRVQALIAEITGLSFKPNDALAMDYKDTREEFPAMMYG